MNCKNSWGISVYHFHHQDLSLSTCFLLIVRCQDLCYIFLSSSLTYVELKSIKSGIILIGPLLLITSQRGLRIIYFTKKVRKETRLKYIKVGRIELKSISLQSFPIVSKQDVLLLSLAKLGEKKKLTWE
jgi:hypothetical protein